MKKNGLLKRTGTLLLAMFMSVASFSTFAPETKLTVKAAGETQDTATVLTPNSEWTAWTPLVDGGTHFYKVVLAEDGELTLSAAFKNCYGVNAFLRKEKNTDILCHVQTIFGTEEDAPVTESDKRVLSAGTYYIEVTGKGVRNKDKGNGYQNYKIKTSFNSYGTSESVEDSYDNPKEYTINTVATDAFTWTENMDWYRFNVDKEGKYIFSITSYGFEGGSITCNAKIMNSDLTEEKLSLERNGGYTQEIKTGDAYLTPGVYYIKLEGKNTKYSFSVKGSTIKKSKITKVKSPKKKKVEVTFKEAKDANGYQIQYSTDKNFKKNVKSKSFENDKAESIGNGYRKITIGKLKRHKKYYFRIRGYVESNKSRFYSDWSNVKNTKIK
ncbi:hypothetical protein [Butyrivibrio sp. WCD2001]|uniref:hypothetical protein n=1 Tax=Butyrivibrio sp. WCD2001 TaxID=1280681 RepID=UPI000419B9A2|nr:hypothetical protein [Butyrivibrio sp. WCD2001]